VDTIVSETALAPLERIERVILTLRGRRIILDTDLAELYEVPTKAFNQAVKRNRNRFPLDFVFQLSREEKTEVVTDCDRLSRLKFSAAPPFAFTEHGAIMAATILHSPRAVEVSIYVVRAFIRMREVMAADRLLARKLEERESPVAGHDRAIRDFVEAIRTLLAPNTPKRRPMGFRKEEGRT
jgi:hypothetical protein